MGGEESREERELGRGGNGGDRGEGGREEKKRNKEGGYCICMCMVSLPTHFPLPKLG